jgi:hypothetical protein
MTEEDPAEVVTKTEWTVRIEGPDLGVFGTEHTFAPAASKSAAMHRLNFYRERRPDINSELLTREAETRRGPWTPVDV